MSVNFKTKKKSPAPLSLMLCAYFNVCNCMYMYIMSSKVLLEKKTPHMIALFDSHVNENINYVYMSSTGVDLKNACTLKYICSV